MTELRVEGSELGKIGAFLRRDFLMAWSYRTAFVSDIVALFGQAIVFAYVARLVNPDAIPAFGGNRTGYLAFVTVGIAITAFLQLGITRLTGVIGAERYMGTLEAVLMSPLRLTTLQLGWVVYDLIYVPIRTILFFVVMALAFNVHFEVAGAGTAALFILTFLPFVWGLGVASASATLVFRRGGLVNGAAGFGLTFFSGAFFPLDLFPRWIEVIARFNPVAITIDGARAALLGGSPIWPLVPSLGLLALMSTVSLIVGLRLFQYAFNRELRSGSIGLY